MVDTSTHLMLDDTNLTVEGEYASEAFAIAGYVNGRFANWPAIVAKYGRSGKFLLSIDVQANPAMGAQCLDIEKGDAQIGQAPGWFKATQAAGKAGKDLRWYPKLYVSAGSAASLIATMAAAGVARNEYMLWSAHYGWKGAPGGAHICGPDTCGFPHADATQYTSTFEGASLDASMCYGYFFSAPGAPVPASPPKPPAPKPLSPNDWAPNQTLKQGSSGDPVRVLQIMLRDSGIVGVRGIAVDGSFGAQTLTAVRNFQAWAKLTVDGVAGPKTRKALFALHDYPPGVETVDEPSTEEAPEAVTVSPVAPVEAPPVPSPSPEPSAPPEPSPEPVAPVYTHGVLDAALAQKTGLPVGTIVFVPQAA